MPLTRHAQRPTTLILSLLTVTLLATPLAAQVQIDYTNGQTDATNYDTSAPNDPTTLSILSGTATQSGVLSGTGRVLKVGDGTLILSGINTYTNDTVVHFGALQVVAGASMSQTPANIFIGDVTGDNGTLLITGGTVGSNSGYIGTHSGSTGTVTMSDGTWTNSDTLFLGNDGTGILNLSGGSVTAQVVYQGFTAGSSGTVNVSGGTLTSNTSYFLGYSGSGVLNLSGGSVTAQDVSLGRNAGGSGTLNLGTGGAVGALNADSISGGSGTAVVNFNHTSSYTFNPTLTGLMTVNQVGPGTTTLTAANTYFGDTLVFGGTLELGFGATTSDILPTTTSLYLGSASLLLSGEGTQSVFKFYAIGSGSIVLGQNQTLDLGQVGSITPFTSVNFNTAAGGADGATVGSGVILVSGQTVGSVIHQTYTVTDSTGFDLATVNASNQIIRHNTDLLPASGASYSDYRIDNNAGDSTVAGSSSLVVTSSQSAVSITVDTTAAAGVLTLDPGVVLGSNIWNFGSVDGSDHAYQITGGAGITASTPGGSVQINNNNSAPVTISTSILDSGSSSGLAVTGSGTTILTAVNTYLGSTIVYSGVLEVAAGASISSTETTTTLVGSDNGSHATLLISGGSVSDTLSILGNSAGSNGTATVSSGSWTSSDSMKIGLNGTGVVNLRSGSVNNDTTSLGYNSGSSGTTNVSGGSWNSNTELDVGREGTGVFNLSGGTVYSPQAFLGWGSGSSGTANVSGGSWTNLGLTVGLNGTGVVNLSGGTISNSLTFLGAGLGGIGTLNVSGGSWINDIVFTVGTIGTGVLNLSGGTVSTAAAALAGSAESSGTANVSGGSWTSSGELHVGYQGTGVLNLTDSGTVTVGPAGSGTLNLATNSGSSGTLNIGTGGAGGKLEAASILGGDGTAVVNFNHTGGYNLQSTLDGSLSVNKLGGGTTTLTLANTYTGTTSVLGGTLELNFVTTPANILPTTTDLTLGSGTLILTGDGTQSVNSLSILAGSAGSIVLDNAVQTLNLGTLDSVGALSALNFDTSASGADGATLGNGVILLSGQTAGAAISSTFTVTDLTGFGLATVNASHQIIRLTTTDLLPASGADIGTDYRIDNNAGTNSDPGSATLTIDTSESARSITVDTTAANGVLTLGTGVIVDTAIWNFGGAGTHTYEITSSDPAAALTTTDSTSLIQFSNFNTAPVTIAVPIIDGPTPVSVLFGGTGTTVLTGSSTYTGDTTVVSGELHVTGDGGINSLGTTTIGSQTGDHAVLTVDHFDLEDATGILGTAAGSTGTATIGSHGEWNHTGNFYIGQNGTGVLNIVDGYSITDGDVHIGSGAGSSGTVNVSTSSLSAYQPGELDVTGTLYIGEEGAGVLNVGDLGVVSANVIKLGAQGTLNIGTGGFTGLVNTSLITSDSSTAVVNFNVGSFSPPVPFDATITGALSVNKLGGGYTVLDVANTYTGRTSILGGTLNLDFSHTSTDILSSASALTLGGGTLVLSGTGSQTFNGLTTLAGTTSGIQLDSDNTLNLGALTLGQNSALNFDVSLGGADGTTVGTSVITLSGLTAGAVISPGFTVSDATGFGLATVNASNQVIRLTTSDLLPATGALGTVDYRIDNNGGNSTDPGSATLTIATSESARSITVDTTAGPGVLTLTGGAVLSTDLWNIGGYAPAYAPYEITSTDASSGISTATAGGMLRINNYAYDEFIISAPILDNGGSGLLVSGPGTTILAGDHDTYTGQTIVSDGASLVITGDRSAVTGTITVQSGTILSGTGTIGGDVQVQSGGSLVAGEAGGCGCGGYTLNGTTVTFQNGSIFLVQGPGDTLSTLHLSGNATIDPGAVISFIHAGTLTQNSYTLITAAGGLDGTQAFTTDAYGFDPRYHLVYNGTELDLTRIPPTTAYWTGKVDNKWSTLASDATNWATAADGLTDPSALPGSPTDVTFSATGVGIAQTDLDADFSINSLTVSSPTVISTTGTQTLTVATTTTISSLLAINSGVTLAGQGDVTIETTGTLAGTGTVQMAAHQSIFVNGDITVGDPTLPAITGAALTLNSDYPYGGIIMGAGSIINVNLYSGAGIGDNTADLSSADRLSFRGTLNATAGGTIVIGNPLGLTGFVGGDQWKILDYNRGSSEITGKLAVNDSSLSLAPGFFGTLNQSTGIYSIADRRPEITAQSSGLAMANAEGQAIIAGVQSALNDVNNHLFNLRAGGGEEGDDDDGSISASLDYGVIEGEGDGPESPMARLVRRSRQWEVFTTVNYGNVKLNPISSQSGVQIDSWATSVGIERHLSRGLTLGFATTFLQSTQTYTGGLGKVDLEGPMLSAYLAYARKGFWSSLLYSFGDFDLGSQRNPGLGLPSAAGGTTAYTNAIQFNTGYNFRFQNNTLVTGPFVGIDYLHGSVDAYSETGGGTGALSYARQTFESLVTRVGWSTSKKFHTDWADITPQFRLSYERQNLKNNGTSVSLINAPFTAAGGNQTPGQDYMVIGTGVNFQFTHDFSMLLGYQVQLFRNNMEAHFGSIRFGYKF